MRRLGRLCARLCTEESGNEALEMAMVLPIYLMTVFTIISFLLVLFGYASATLGSKMGVRYAVVHSSTSLVPCTQPIVTSTVLGYVIAPLASSVTVNPVWSPGNTIGSTVTVSVTLNYTSMPYGFLNNFAPVAAAKGVIVN
jgi:Flp pilus assembly protein TadG